MNTYLIIVLVFIGLRYVLDTVSSTLNVAHLEEKIPPSFEGIYNDEKYRLSQSYLRTNTRFTILKDSFGTLLTLVFLLMGGFNWADLVARSVLPHPIAGGLVFAGILLLLSKLLSLPFDIYDTFVIEERFGFNKTSVRTYLIDQLKSLILIALLGGFVFAAAIWFFESLGALAWLYIWGALTILQLLLMYIAPVLIMPIFNTFTPLEEGELRSAIEAYAQSQNFTMKGVYRMDGSRRSSKSNAFFTGFGRSRRIVLFDTLIENQTVQELVSIVAHEMGHYKCKHIPKGIGRAILQTGLCLFLLSQFIDNPSLFAAFKMEHVSIYAGIIFFGFLYNFRSQVFWYNIIMIKLHHEHSPTAGQCAKFRSIIQNRRHRNMSADILIFFVGINT